MWSPLLKFPDIFLIPAASKLFPFFSAFLAPSSEEINKIIGCHSNEIQEILGYVSKSEVVHKDDMVEVWWKIY